MFHSITGCDTVSFFSGREKTSAWDVWNAFPQITDTISMLASVPEEIPEQAMALIERFVALLYSMQNKLPNDSEQSKTGTHQLKQLFFNTRGVQYTRLGTFGGMHMFRNRHYQVLLTGAGKKMKTSGNWCGHCYLKHNRYATNSFTVAV